MVETVRANYYNNLTSNESCDIDIRVGQKLFQCHQSVLRSASKYFDVMLQGNFVESSAREVVLRELDARVFEVMLKFMYTKETAAINSSNLYDILCAAHYYQVDDLVKYCIGYIYKNLNEIADVILKIFWYADRVNMKESARFLKRHIYENFGYFSNVPEFGQLSIDILLEILGVGSEEHILLPQDVFLDGICSWITDQKDLNLDEKKSYFDRLCQKLDLTHFSDLYAETRLPECMTVLASSDDSIYSSTAALGVVQSCPKLLRAYVSTLDSDSNKPKGTSIFTGFSSCSPKTWMYSGEVKNFFPEYMENVVLDNRLYNLSYSSPRLGEDQQTFRCSSYASMYPYTPLSLPPLCSWKFDMVGTANEIYLYSKSSYPTPSAYSLFSGDELSRGLFLYKRDIDRWLPLPGPTVTVRNASLSCDDKRLYLIGGISEFYYSLRRSNQVQAYDIRSGMWYKLCATNNSYLYPTSCIYGKEICVVERCDGLRPREFYDIKSGYWRSDHFSVSVIGRVPHLVNWSGRLVMYHRADSQHIPKIKRYSKTEDHKEWITLPDINKAVASVDCIPEKSRLRLLNLITF